MSQETIIQGKNTNYQIRLANQHELPRLPVIERTAARRFTDIGLTQLENITLPMELLTEAQKAGHIWVITTMIQEIVGFAVVLVLKGQLHLEEIDIDPGHGRQGLGRAMIEAICEWASAAGFKTISLSTFRDVPWNAPYYERLGFSIIPENELTEDLMQIQKKETDMGLAVSHRVFMRKKL